MSLPIWNITQWGKDNNVGSYSLSYATSLEKIMSTIFKWEGLPEEIEGWMIERLLFWRGECAFWKLGDKYITTPFVKKDWDMYNLTTIANPIPYNGKGPTSKFTLHREDIKPKIGFFKEKAVFITNNINKKNTLFPVITLLREMQGVYVELSNERKNSRSINLFNANDKKTAKTMKNEIDNIYYGNEPFAILTTASQKIIDSATRLGDKDKDRTVVLWESFSKYKKEINELVGIPFDSRAEKKERVLEQEVNVSQIQVNETLQGMLMFRERAVKEINKTFNLNITVGFDSHIENALEQQDNQEQINTNTNKIGDNENEIQPNNN